MRVDVWVCVIVNCISVSVLLNQFDELRIRTIRLKKSVQILGEWLKFPMQFLIIICYVPVSTDLPKLYFI